MSKFKCMTVFADFPMLALYVVILGLSLYFMTNLDLDAGKFFIYLLFIYVATFCTPSPYRMLAAMSPTRDDAVRFSGLASNLLVILTGYVIAKPILLSQRQVVGVVTGNLLLDGKPLVIEFGRGTGFVEQMDLHNETATVPEATEFSALLRQSRDIPRTGKP